MINVLEYLEESARNHPDKIAILENSMSITYAELNEKSRRIGSSLAAMTGAPVGIYMEKGIDALCALFGVVSAGAFYTMINTELPNARIQKIQTVLQAKVIITSSELKEKAHQLFAETSIFTIDELVMSEINEELLSVIRSRTIDTDPLYTIFTSGTTGVPKGIIVSHRSVIDFTDHFTNLFSITSKDIIANQAPFDFDISVKDIYSSVKTGATLVIVPRRLFTFPAKLLDSLSENDITTMIWSVSALCLITTAHGLDYKVPKTVSKILFSGEVMPYKHLSEWQKHFPDALFVNLYGPTEITCNCTYHILEKDRDYSLGIPIGKPFPNEDVFLLDENNRKITDPEKKGEIVVRGSALALGYYNLPQANSEKFVLNPLNTAYPERIYRTGDLGRYSEEGELFYCGRMDNQIKYMGHRIELEEVEAAMASVDGVDRCFCIFDRKKEMLKGYFVGTIEKKELYNTLAETMPSFMLPGYMRKLDFIPLTKNGKIDRHQFADI